MGGMSEATVTTGKKKAADIEAAGGKKKEIADAGLNNFGFSQLPPMDAPTQSDKSIRAAKMAQALALMSGRGTRSAMRNGQFADTSVLGGI